MASIDIQREVGNKRGERIEVIVGGRPLGENLCVAGCDQPTSLAFECFEYECRAALNMPLVYFPVDEIDDFLGKPNGNLLAHITMVLAWDAERYHCSFSLDVSDAVPPT